MEEKWLPVVGLEGYYEVSNKGRIKSLERYVCMRNCQKWIPESLITPHRNINGYYCVTLSKDGFAKREYLHRIVANAFLPNPMNLPFINHKDENPANNCVDNLEWCTHRYNSNYGTCRDRASKKLRNHPALSDRVIQMTLDENPIAEFPSMSEAERVTGIAQQNICACCRGKVIHAGGYKWRYVSCALTNVLRRKNDPTIKNFRSLEKAIPISAKKDGESFYTLYRSSEAAGRGTGIPNGSIRRHAKNGGKYHYRGYEWEVSTNEQKMFYEQIGIFDVLGEAITQQNVEEYLSDK